MATNNNDDKKIGEQPFNIDMDLPTLLPQSRGGFVKASEVEDMKKVKRSTFLVRMPMLLSRGILIKRLATILLPRHKNIAFLPHTSSTHDKITDHELVPIDDMGISHYIFDERTSIRNRGKKNEYKMLECKLHIESPISLYKIKGAQEVMELLKKHDIYVTAKSYCPAVNTKAIGILMNLDAKRSAKNKIIDNFKDTIDEETSRNVFLDMVPHRGLVRLGKKVIYGQFLKIMVDVNYATVTAKIIQEGLKKGQFGVGLKHVRLMPVYPIPNLMSPEMFGKMIAAHNDSMYSIAEIQVDNIWEIDIVSTLPNVIKKRFNLPYAEENKNDVYTLRDIIMPIFWGHYKNEPVVRDVYVMRGRLMIVCEKKKIAETTKLVDMLLQYLKDEYDVESDTLERNEDKFAEWVGCSTPKNKNRHPARSGTLIFGEGGVLKATVNSFLDSKLDSLPEGLVPTAGAPATKPDLSRPPPASLIPRGRTLPSIDPTEFTATAVKAWASAKTWASIAKPKTMKDNKKHKNKQNQKVPERAVIDLDNVTQSTMSMTSGTQAALDAMRQSVNTLQLEKQKNEKKIETLDETIAQIAREVTKLSEAQRKSNNDYVQIKEQIVTIAKDSGEIRSEMIEMKSMIMSIAHHLGGVRNDNNDEENDDNDKTTNSPAQTQYEYSSSLTLPNTQSLDSTTMSDIDINMSFDQKYDKKVDETRKKQKQNHTQVFNTQASPQPQPPRANHPTLLPPSASVTSNGSDNNLSMSEEDVASMYD
jgi:hypothetical protein